LVRGYGGAVVLTEKRVLARIPTRSIGFDVPPRFVYSALGIPRG
jgi:hypothetical protein